MYRITPICLAFAASFGLLTFHGATAAAQDQSCPTCHGELTITSYTPGEGDLTRPPDDTFATWSAGSVKLSCDDGATVDAVTLAVEPYDLEDGLDLQTLTLPDVDLTATGLTCELQVDDGSSYATIDVDIM